MRTLVYGGGSVGLGIASCLLKAGGQVDIIAREDTVRDLRKAGLTRAGIFGDYHAEPSRFSSYRLLDEMPKRGYDYSAEAAEDLSGHAFLFNMGT